MSGESVAVPPTGAGRRHSTWTLWLGFLIMLVVMSMVFNDVRISGRGVLEQQWQIDALRKPVTRFEGFARFCAVNICALVWAGYLIFMEGVLCVQDGRGPVRRRPHHFVFLFLSSILIWCLFDWINFCLGMKAWNYLGMQSRFYQRLWGDFIAFGAIVPGMLMSAQALLNWGIFDWARSGGLKMPRWALFLSLVIGVGMIAWPLVALDPMTNLTLWTSLVLLLDPINYWLGRPSMFRDWQRGWYGRTLALMAGGAICGLLWEFWNFFAITKWTYSLPFMGWMENVKYCQMPLIGFLGFLPFGIECWVMWQTIRMVLDGLVEPLPDETCVM